MRKLIYTLIVPAALMFGSCSDWLEIPPPTSISDKVLFETEEGFQEATIGLYSTASAYNLYGGVFTMELLDAMMQNYSYETSDPTDYLETSQFDYKYELTRTRFSMVWEKAYNTIVNCNLILENLEEKRDDLFHEGMAEMIEAEARAMRAYLHFDMLRLCVPVGADKELNGGRLAIPYVTTYSNQITPVGSTNEVLGYIIEDLAKAKELLDGRDPIIDPQYVVDYPVNQQGGQQIPEQNIVLDPETGEILPFFEQNRRHRMNYYAVCGALARVHLWKATVCGDAASFELAANNASEVIESNKFKWVDADYITGGGMPGSESKNNYDREFYTELVFAFYIQTADGVGELRDRFNDVSGGYFVENAKLSDIYEGQIYDTRYTTWFRTQTGSNSHKSKIIKYLRNTESDENSGTSIDNTATGNLHYLVSPAIRLSEMYYIVAECLHNQPGLTGLEFTTAMDALNFVREKRELSPLGAVNFIDELLKEYRKETYAEGQALLNYKRLYHAIPTMAYDIQPGDTQGGHTKGIYYPTVSDHGTYDWLPKSETDNRVI